MTNEYQPINWIFGSVLEYIQCSDVPQPLNHLKPEHYTEIAKKVATWRNAEESTPSHFKILYKDSNQITLEVAEDPNVVIKISSCKPYKRLEGHIALHTITHPDFPQDYNIELMLKDAYRHYETADEIGHATLDQITCACREEHQARGLPFSSKAS